MIRSSDQKWEIDALILERANTVLNLGYVPDWTPQERIAVLDEFRKALRDYPIWAVSMGFTRWIKTNPRRPSPAEIVLLVTRELKPITDELAERKREVEAQQSAADRRVTKESADAILASAGFTPRRFSAVRDRRMASSEEELFGHRGADLPPHWSQKVAADSPEMEALRRARADNPIMQKSIRDAQIPSD